MAAPQQATQFEMETLSHAVNQLGANRSTWNSVSTCEDSDNPGVVYVSKTLGAPWHRIGAKLGSNTGSTWIIVPV